MTSSEKLAAAMTESGAPQTMINRAKAGYYSDFDSPLDLPLTQLVIDLRAAGLIALMNRAKNGEFDATKEECDAWYEREGRKLVEEMGLPKSAFERKPNTPNQKGNNQ